ncbi:chondrolectin [Salarias fasciatus]|uniref:chondrolectin n=1 Tax=Salarias fasciatus TaxID=181472 RepID=UPI0011769D81|nr:chondrolectin [Salarias fasciatus]
MVTLQLVVMVMLLGQVNGVRVLSGQTVCVGGPKRPCYKIAYFHDVSSRVAFSEAQQACSIDGGQLLSIESPEEQREIQHLLQELSSGAVGGAAGGGIADGDFWIGLTRVEGEDQGHSDVSTSFPSCPKLYMWTDGSVASFRNWYLDEPSCGGESCVVMYHQPAAFPGPGGKYLYQWNDDRCNMKHNFICKYGPESILVNKQGDTPDGRSTVTAGEDAITTSTGREDVPSQFTTAGAAGMLLLYVVIPTIPLLLLILVASGTCCFQMLHRSHPHSKTATDQANLWISSTAKPDGMEV